MTPDARDEHGRADDSLRTPELASEKRRSWGALDGVLSLLPFRGTEQAPHTVGAAPTMHCADFEETDSKRADLELTGVGFPRPGGAARRVLSQTCSTAPTTRSAGAAQRPINICLLSPPRSFLNPLTVLLGLRAVTLGVFRFWEILVRCFVVVQEGRGVDWWKRMGGRARDCTWRERENVRALERERGKRGVGAMASESQRRGGKEKETEQSGAKYQGASVGSDLHSLAFSASLQPCCLQDAAPDLHAQAAARGRSPSPPPPPRRATEGPATSCTTRRRAKASYRFDSDSD
eukprot:2748150-Rhodomonas_salina.3